jgi:UDP-glucose 4-epimerase
MSKNSPKTATAKKKAPRRKAATAKQTARRPRRKPTILVTGAGGALAQRTIQRLKHHYNIIALDFRHKPEISACTASYCIQFTKREFEDIFREHDIDGVLHLGRISAFQQNRISRYNANVIGTKKLLDLCVKYGVSKVTVLSTYHVYGAHPYNPALIEEDAPLKAAELTMDLVDSVELENLANIYLWKHPSLHICILRPCNIVGPGINNTMSRLLSRGFAPWVVGFSPMMQFIHVDDMADAIAESFRHHRRGIFNVAPDDWVAYTRALEECHCRKVPIPPVPDTVPKLFSNLMGWRSFPRHLVNYFKYPVIIDGSLFRDTFGFRPQYNLREIFAHYRETKS